MSTRQEKTAQERRTHVPDLEATWVPEEVPQIWTNRLWETLGSYALVATADGPALKVTPGHRRLAAVLAVVGLAALAAGVIGGALEWWPGSPDAVWAQAAAVVGLGVGPVTLLAYAEQWLRTVVAGEPSTGLVLLSDPKATTTAQQGSRSDGTVRRGSGRRALRQQRRAFHAAQAAGHGGRARHLHQASDGPVS